MNPEEASQEAELADLLATYDEALAQGVATPGDLALPDLPARLETDLACLHLLHQLRPADATPSPDELNERYSLIRLHGAGGMGQVWVAHDADLDRQVALKELRLERVQDRALARRFLREARITGQLQHPGIVPVYELVTGDGSADPPFYTMRLVQGRTLTDAARAYHDNPSGRGPGRLDLVGLLNAFVSVCQTIAYAHSRGVIHRDLKGANVVLGDFGEVIVVDWGFAKVIGQTEEALSSTKDQRLSASPEDTLVGSVIGTPAYMAPEQASGRSELIDFRTDVYGLGAILYEILTGRPPFTGENTDQLLRKVREEEPTPPQSLCPSAPAPLVAVCCRALARQPSARYASVTELAREIQHWLADEPVQAHREPLRERWRRWARRHRTAVASLTALVFTGLLALVLSMLAFKQQQTRTAADRANAEARARGMLENRLYYHRIALAERDLAASNLNRAQQLLDACPADLRGWEWHCLHRLCHTDQRILRGHTAAISAVAFCPTAPFLASASHDRTIKIWDLASGQLRQTLTGHDDVVYGVAYHPGGKLLASASWDRTVKIWDLVNARNILTYHGHQEEVHRVVFSPDGQRVVSLSNRAVNVWDAQTGTTLHTLGEESGVNCYGLAYSPNGRHLAITHHNQTVTLWDVEQGKQLRVFRGHTSAVKNANFSADGRWLASGAGDLVRSQPGEVKVWNVDTGRELFHLPGHTDPIFAVAFSPDGRRLASASQDQTVKLWDLSAGHEALTLRAHGDTVRAVAFSPDGRYLVSAGADGLLKLWDATPWLGETPTEENLTLLGSATPIFQIVFRANGKELVAATDHAAVLLWDLPREGEPTLRSLDVESQIYTVAVHPNGTQLVTATADGKIWFLHAQTGKVERQLESGRWGPIKSLAFSPDGQHLACALWSRVILVWDLSQNRLRYVLEGHGDAVTCVMFSPDGQQLASASHDHTVRLWDVATGKSAQILQGHTSRVHSLAFSPDGRALVSGSNDGTLRLWDLKTGRLPRTLSGHASGVNSVAFSPDGRLLASASKDWTVKVWHPTTGALIRTLRGHTDGVHTVAFSPNSRRLASAGADRTVQVWQLDSLLPPNPP